MVRVERPLAAPLLQGKSFTGIVAPGASRKIGQRVVDGGAIVLDQLDEIGLLDEPARLDQVTGTLASF